eukprot:TRINITY_DN7090_c0_g1_i3.p2 TRINITY_DN7090_c0_g1~~TRINITY_DN7090_c0_g1_i3.p2  ORF type:complete len:374 (+),score=127.58 TRINITY_DN7090_c0_g1_i3:589-1710(+)
MESIQEMVRWLGHTPTRVTYSSDYFGRLYALAEELIDRGKAYVCHQTSAEMKAGREAKADSPWRGRPVAENRRLFAAMRAGKFNEGTAVLRMKIDMQSLNPCMQDPIAYRIKFVPHPHVGDAWCVYPSYDYTHCIVDSLEWVTHSLCTLEFEIRRDSYYWLLAALDLYRPFVWEFSRLTLAHTVVSKRRLARLVSSGAVRGWDDPRMSTLAGLRRRGFPAEAINRFCAAIGVSRGENLIPLHVLDHWVRAHLDGSAPRTLAVVRPLRVTLTNFRGGGGGRRRRRRRRRWRRRERGAAVGGQPPQECGGGGADGAADSGHFHRRRRLSGGRRAQVLWVGAGQKGDAPRRLPADRHGGGAGRRRVGGGARGGPRL